MLGVEENAFDMSDIAVAGMQIVVPDGLAPAQVGFRMRFERCRSGVAYRQSLADILQRRRLSLANVTLI